MSILNKVLEVAESFFDDRIDELLKSDRFSNVVADIARSEMREVLEDRMDDLTEMVREDLRVLVESNVEEILAEVLENMATSESRTSDVNDQSKDSDNSTSAITTPSSDELPDARYQNGDLDELSERAVRVMSAIQNIMVAEGNPTFTYEDVFKEIGARNTHLVSDSVKELQEKGWIERERSGSSYETHLLKTLPSHPS